MPSWHEIQGFPAAKENLFVNAAIIEADSFA